MAMARRRGTYKRYLQDPAIPLPKRTERRRRKAQDRIDSDGAQERNCGHSVPADAVNTGDNVNNALNQLLSDDKVACDDNEILGDCNDISRKCISDKPGENLASHDIDDNDNESDHNEDLIPSVSQNCGTTESADDSSSIEDSISGVDGNSVSDNESSSERGSDDNGESSLTERIALILQAYKLRYGLTKDAMEDLLTIINLVSPNLLPKSTFLFRKFFEDRAVSHEMHFYCCNCLLYFGRNGDLPVHCEACDVEFDRETSLSKGNFFMVLPLSPQLQNLFQNESISNAVKECDVEHGNIFSRMRRNSIYNDDDISLLWNCDGVPLFKSSTYSVWPIQCIVNELPFSLRKDNILLPALWFGTEKPKMSTFLKPFVQECEELARSGFTWVDPISNEEKTTIVHTMICTADAIARPLIRNCKQFNASYGCDWCLHPGEHVERGRGYSHVYSFEDNPDAEKRTAHHFLGCAEQAVDGIPSFGVKGPSITQLIPNFDIVNGFVPDYLHCVLLGVTRQFMALWVGGESKEKPWHLPPRKVKELSSRMTEAKPPNEVTRTPRPIHLRKYWKGSEWRSFLLFYSLVVLQGLLPPVYLNHWFLLVYSLHTLLGNTVSRESIQKADSALRRFVQLVEELYGLEHMTFNVHQLLHLAESVRNWGPLWCISSFPFEGNNRALLNFFRGTQGIPKQMCDSFSLWQDLTRRGATVTFGSDIESALFQKILGNAQHRKRASELGNGLISLGSYMSGQLTVVQQLAIERLLGRHIVNTKILSFCRFIWNKSYFTTNQYAIAKKRANYYIMCQDDTFNAIQSLVILKPDCTCIETYSCSCTSLPVILVKPLLIVRAPVYSLADLQIRSDFLINVETTQRTSALYLENIKCKCTYVSCGNKSYLVPLPNDFERD